MEFENHLFISYAHIDNEPLTEQSVGWVTRFHSSLSTMLGMRLGRKAAIWRDSKLQGSDIFGDEIVRQFPKAALLVAVLSPRYVQSEWCIKEITEFCEAAKRSGGLMVGEKPRVFKIIKTPFENSNDEVLPDVVQGQLGYQFFIRDEGQAPIELDPAYGKELVEKYNLKLAKLAFEMAQRILAIESTGPSAPEEHDTKVAETEPPKAAVYLAECSYDQREHREAMETELRLHGYTVLPDQPLPRDEQAFIEMVNDMLARCQLSIHLIGSAFGAVPDGPTEKSTAELQNTLAISQSRNANLQRVIWLPEKTTSTSELQQQFISSLHSDAETQFGADLITGDIEVLKGAIHVALKANEKSESPGATPGETGEGKLIYLICDKRDRSATIPLRRHLTGLGHKIEIPVFEGSAAEVHDANRELLNQCDAVILFHGAGSEIWKRAAETDIRKTKAGRETPLRINFTYLAGPESVSKRESIELEEPNLIDGLDGFADSAIEPFLKALDDIDSHA